MCLILIIGNIDLPLQYKSINLLVDCYNYNNMLNQLMELRKILSRLSILVNFTHYYNLINNNDTNNKFFKHFKSIIKY